MGHYHPVSYEVEGRIRPGEKLEGARRRRMAQAARAGRKRSRPDVSSLSRVGRAVAAAATVVRGLRPLAPERG